ncbi:Dbl homology domain-containing protein [Phycomyces nitens]|nr:Dbl homology domain-containing protein [Phycomyces nitens]
MVESTITPYPPVNDGVYTLPTSIEEEVAARKEFLKHPTEDIHGLPYRGFKPNVFGTPCSYKTWKESINPKQFQQLSRLSTKQQRYQELIHEIILTECKYIEDLELVQKIFIKDAVKWEGLPSTLLKIFNSTNKIVELHKSILKDLICRQTKEHPEIRTIGDIFHGYVDSMEIYSTYFVNFEQANHIITNALKAKSEQLGIYIRNRASWSECRNLPLQSFMLLPIQRIMKYPLFFRQLKECLEPEDPAFWEIQHLETKIDKAIRLIENDKAEAERYHRLEDLNTRISGLDNSINLLIPGRRLIYEGPLDLLPCSQNPLTDSSNDMYGSSLSFNPCGSVQSLYVHRPYLQRQNSTHSITSPHPNVLKRRNSTFSIKEKRKHLYVFLFDDLIICTKIRSTTREIDENIMAKAESYHGPNPEALFRVVQEPGKLTLVDRTVTRKVPRQDKTGRLLGSLRKPTTATINAMYNSTTEYEEHPLQFMCSIASKRIVVCHFEAPTAHEKDTWCTHLQEASKLHVRSPDKIQHESSKDPFEYQDGPMSTGTENNTDQHTENESLQNKDDLDNMDQAHRFTSKNDACSDDYPELSLTDDQLASEGTPEQTLASALREASQELSRISLESGAKTENMDFVMDFAVDLNDTMGPQFKISDFDKYVFNSSHERFSVPVILEEKEEPMDVKYYTLKSPRVERFPQTFKI